MKLLLLLCALAGPAHAGFRIEFINGKSSVQPLADRIVVDGEWLHFRKDDGTVVLYAKSANVLYVTPYTEPTPTPTPVPTPRPKFKLKKTPNTYSTDLLYPNSWREP